MTWVLSVWGALILIWIIVGIIQIATKNCSSLLDSAFSGDATCTNIAVNGKSHVALAEALGKILIWLLGFIVLAVIWFMTRQKVRTCPQCGENVAKGVTACGTCGYDFALGKNPAHDSAPAPVAPAPAQVASAPPEGWYDDGARPGRKRWWDGTAWGIRDDEHPSVASGTPRADADGANATPVASGSPPPELGPEHAVDAEIAVPPAGLPPGTRQEPAVIATAVKPNSEAAPVAVTSSAPEDAAAPRVARFCENCGAERSAGKRFCTGCGEPFD